jgi:hypothetical protein
VSHEPPDPFAESLAAHHAKVDADRDAEIAPLKAEYGKLENTCLAWKEANDALKAEVETLKVTRTDLRAQLAESERLRAEAEAAGVISGQAIGRREAAQEVERLANIIEDERQFSADEKARREKAEAALKERDTQLSALRDREAALVEALKERILQNCEEADGSQCEPHWDCSAAHAAIANPTQAGVDWRASVEREAKLEQETCDKQAMLLVLATTGRALGLPLPAEETHARSCEKHPLFSALARAETAERTLEASRAAGQLTAKTATELERARIREGLEKLDRYDLKGARPDNYIGLLSDGDYIDRDDALALVKP